MLGRGILVDVAARAVDIERLEKPRYIKVFKTLSALVERVVELICGSDLLKWIANFGE